MNKYELAKKITQLDGLTNEEKASLVELLRSQKKYGLVWEDKPEEIETRLVDELPVLTEVPERAIVSESPDAPNHILIEGDNLEALTALAYTHEGKIDVIYIDPPYNTGNKDFVYNDSFVDREDGYRHSKWLSFMNKRLQIAKSLLSSGGVIFISIDDNEQAQLKLLCDEVFGAKNFVATLPTIMNLKGNQDEFGFAGTHEYTLIYCLSYDYCVIGQLPLEDEELDDWQIDEKGYYKKGANLKSTGINAPKEKRPNLYYPILVNKITSSVSTITKDEFCCIYNKDLKQHNEEYLAQLRTKYESLGFYFLLPATGGKGMSWRWGWQKVKTESDEIIVCMNGDEVSLYKKQRPQLGEMPSKKPKSIFYKPEYSSGNGKAELLSVLGESLFGYPKPLKLIMDFLTICSRKNSTILDFFAGSGTTLHATMQLNAEDGGHRKCILVTNNENNICEEVTYERNKRVIQGYTTPKGEEVEGLHDNNLRYYRTTLLSRDKSVKNMRQLVRLATDLLCIKNDVYTEAEFCGKHLNPNIARYFDNGQGNRMLVIYEERAIQLLVQLMAQTEDDGIKTMVYVFSPGADPYTDDFEDVAERVKLCALPSAIYEAYKRVLPKRKPKFLDEALREMKTQAEAEANAQQTLDFGEDNNMNEEGGEA